MSIVDWLYPKRCVGCKREGRYICDGCIRGIRRVGGSLRYTGLVRKILKEIKYRGTYDMVAELVEIWNPVWKEEYQGAIITAVPMWRSKQRVRGFNQAELIAKELARRWEVEYGGLLVRTRETKPMYGLSKGARAKNVRGAFKLIQQAETLRDQKVILVDDVWTTGATVRECTSVLTQAGARNVFGLTLAR